MSKIKISVGFELKIYESGFTAINHYAAETLQVEDLNDFK